MVVRYPLRETEDVISFRTSQPIENVLNLVVDESQVVNVVIEHMVPPNDGYIYPDGNYVYQMVTEKKEFKKGHTNQFVFSHNPDLEYRNSVTADGKTFHVYDGFYNEDGM